MELLLVITLLLLTAVAITFIARGNSTQRSSAKKVCEAQVASALQTMDIGAYTTFNNLILHPDGTSRRTKIDHVVVSPHGIFCIETKAQQGLIYGSMGDRQWTQHLGSHEYKLPNPHQQNYKHIKALEDLLGDTLKAPIHSYVTFPNAKRIRVDGTEQLLSINNVIHMITGHTKHIYRLAEYEQILKTLAYASTKSSELSDVHIQEVQTYLKSL